MRLQGKSGIVTAGASGMGRAGCRLFAENGATVAIIDINEAAAAALADEINGGGGKARAFAGNLADEDDCRRVMRESVEWLGGLDFLWAHAGIPGPSKVEDLDMGEYQTAIDLNLTSAVVCAAEAAPHMRARGGGSIVFTSSVGGLVGSMMSPVYSMTKFGVVGFTMSLAQRFAADGIRVNAVCPGPVDTPMLPQFFGRSDDERSRKENEAKLMAIVPLGRAAQPEEIAHGALWLLSDDASFVTGVALPIDGGYVCR